MVQRSEIVGRGFGRDALENALRHFDDRDAQPARRGDRREQRDARGPRERRAIETDAGSGVLVEYSVLQPDPELAARGEVRRLRLLRGADRQFHMSAVHGVSGLEGDYALPTPLGNLASDRHRGAECIGEVLLKVGVVEHFDRT